MRRVRDRVAAVVMVVAATAIVLGPAEASPPRQQKPGASQNGYVRLPSTRVGAWAVSVEAQQGSDRVGLSLHPSVCLEMVGHRSNGPGRRVSVRATGCTENFDFHFDRVAWSAQTSGWAITDVTEQAERFRDGTWHHAGSPVEWAAAVWFYLTSSGEGPIEPHVGVSGFPGSCYALPPICMGVEGYLERPARVSGTVSSRSIGANLRLWNRSGRMGYLLTD